VTEPTPAAPHAAAAAKAHVREAVPALFEPTAAQLLPFQTAM